MEFDATTTPETPAGGHVVAQPVAAPLTRAAIFLIVTAKPGPTTRAIVRSLCGDLAGLVRAVEFRDLEAGLSCVMGFGSDAWDQLFGAPLPLGLEASVRGPAIRSWRSPPTYAVIPRPSHRL